MLLTLIVIVTQSKRLVPLLPFVSHFIVRPSRCLRRPCSLELLPVCARKPNSQPTHLSPKWTCEWGSATARA
ncbi:hypothetical protein L596_004883 [Steinernema carpocapsae]|uniref:Uncharacterized protein n=1 Tax=Steinernema carpocapsae TaxID=34508 RepID=A0A4U8UX53_STECR|nr:hypothetical protein L596_004883 [Steinernema carpocapsae]